MQQIIEKLRLEGVKNSTRRSYYSAWRTFNHFFVRLDVKPDNWEDRLVLFVGFLIKERKQSQTIKSYISAIKKVLQDDNVIINENRVLLSSLTKACKMKNDKVRTRLPIQKGILRILLRETKTYYDNHNQSFLAVMYQALFSTAYFGMFRVGELTTGTHPIMVKDVQLARNKNKIMFVLRTSKTHGENNHPQIVKITSKQINENISFKRECDGNLYCPYELLRRYIDARPKYLNKREPFFIFRDGTPVRPDNMRENLKFFLKESGFNPILYNTHSLRAGRSVDLRKMNVSLDLIRKLGRWSSNSVFAYLHTH